LPEFFPTLLLLSLWDSLFLRFEQTLLISRKNKIRLIIRISEALTAKQVWVLEGTNKSTQHP
jgi:hypothetical protein